MGNRNATIQQLVCRIKIVQMVNGIQIINAYDGYHERSLCVFQAEFMKKIQVPFKLIYQTQFILEETLTFINVHNN